MSDFVRALFVPVYLYLFVSLVYCFQLTWRNIRTNNWLFLHGERGQGLVEYALILVMVAVVVIAVLLLLGPTIRDVF